MRTYKINEIFYSIQGEGANTGRPAIFIRLSGCNLKCPFCDTAHQEFYELTIAEIIKQVRDLWPLAQNPFIVITGGEPGVQLDEDLLTGLREELLAYIAVETNGSYNLPAGLDFVTISPKADFVKRQVIRLQRATEVKVVFDGKINPEKWFDSIAALYYYLQPCDTGDAEENKKILSLCVEYIERHPWWRLSLQTQKILNVR